MVESATGVASKRFVGYVSKVRHWILEYEGKETAVMKSKCEVKCVLHDGHGLEVHSRNYVKVVKLETL